MASREFLASFGVEIDEAGVARLRKVLGIALAGSTQAVNQDGTVNVVPADIRKDLLPSGFISIPLSGKL